VVHRDVKLENVLIDADDRPKLADFGLSTAADMSRLTRTGMIVGTPAYMSPEQVRGKREAIGPHSDVWSLGVMLYRILSGADPFTGTSLSEIGTAICHGRPKPLREHDPSIDASLQAVCACALSPQPANRYPDGEGFAEALDEALQGVGRTPIGRGGKILIGLALLAVLQVVAVGGLYLAKRSQAQPPPPATDPADSALDPWALARTGEWVAALQALPADAPPWQRGFLAGRAGDAVACEQALGALADPRAAALRWELLPWLGAEVWHPEARSLPLHPTAWDWVVEGSQRLAQGQTALATQSFSSAARGSQDDPALALEAHLGLARAELARGRFQNAAEALSAAALDATDPADRLRCHSLAARVGQVAEDTRTTLRDLIGEAPVLELSSPTALGRTRQAIANGESEGGVRSEGSFLAAEGGALARGDDGADGLLVARAASLARAAERGNHVESARLALTLLEQAERLRPASPTVWAARALAHLVTHDPAQALAAAERALALSPGDPAAILLRGRALAAGLEPEAIRLAGALEPDLDGCLAIATGWSEVADVLRTARSQAAPGSGLEVEARLRAASALLAQARWSILGGKGTAAVPPGAALEVLEETAPLVAGLDLGAIRAARQQLATSLCGDADTASVTAAEDALAQAAAAVTPAALDALRLRAGVGEDGTWEVFLALAGDLPTRARLQLLRRATTEDTVLRGRYVERALALAPADPRALLERELLGLGSAGGAAGFAETRGALARLGQIIHRAPEWTPVILAALRLRPPAAPVAKRALSDLDTEDASAEGLLTHALVAFTVAALSPNDSALARQALQVATRAAQLPDPLPAADLLRAQALAMVAPDDPGPELTDALTRARAAMPWSTAADLAALRLDPGPAPPPRVERLLAQGFVHDPDLLAKGGRRSPRRLQTALRPLSRVLDTMTPNDRRRLLDDPLHHPVLADRLEVSDALPLLRATLRLSPSYPQFDRLPALDEVLPAQVLLAQTGLATAQALDPVTQDRPELVACALAARQLFAGDSALAAATLASARVRHRLAPAGGDPRPRMPARGGWAEASRWSQSGSSRQRLFGPQLPPAWLWRSAVSWPLSQPARLFERVMMRSLVEDQRPPLFPHGLLPEVSPTWVLLEAPCDPFVQKEALHWAVAEGRWTEARLALDRAAAFSDAPLDRSFDLADQAFMDGMWGAPATDQPQPWQVLVALSRRALDLVPDGEDDERDAVRTLELAGLATLAVNGASEAQREQATTQLRGALDDCPPLLDPTALPNYRRRTQLHLAWQWVRGWDALGEDARAQAALDVVLDHLDVRGPVAPGFWRGFHRAVVKDPLFPRLGELAGYMELWEALEERVSRQAQRTGFEPPTPGPAADLSLILGRPTDRSVVVSLRAVEPREAYLEYGAAALDAKSDPVRLPAGVAVEVELNGLRPDTRYTYRLRSRAPGEAAYATGDECGFHTQRATGAGFRFAVQGDSHPERTITLFNADLYERTLRNVATDAPDFYVTMGDDFSLEHLYTRNQLTEGTLQGLYARQRGFLGLVGKSAPLFLVNGNEDYAAGYLLDGTPNNWAIQAGRARLAHFPLPAPDGFYSGNEEPVEHLGLPRNYYAWRWGDALFVVLDPYWHSPDAVDATLASRSSRRAAHRQGAGANRGQGGGVRRQPPRRRSDREMWRITLGDAQYAWLRETLLESPARHRFVFAHHVLGTGRGGIERAPFFEWGGQGSDREDAFARHRPGWKQPIHALFVEAGVTVFFQGHDHLFARQELDGVVYQTVPSPADTTYNTHNDKAYKSGDLLANSGHLRVTVEAERVRVEYVRAYLPQDEDGTRANGDVAFSYTIPPE
jgi:tetratricopeptide (TPR) repeat protein